MSLIQSFAGFSKITLGGEMFHVRRLRGEGAYAKVFQASTLDPMNVTIMPSFDDSDEDDEDEDDEKQVSGSWMERKTGQYCSLCEC